MIIAVVGNKQEFLYWCHEDEIHVRQGGVLGEKENTTYVCCNVGNNALGRIFDDAVFLRSSYLDKNMEHLSDIVLNNIEEVNEND